MTSSLVEPAEGELVAIGADDGAEAATGATSKRFDGTFHYLMLALCVAVVGLSAVLSVRGGTQVLLPIVGQPLPELCHFKRYSGIDCPGCGLTRAFISLAHGRWTDAWRYNPAAFLLFPIVLFQIPYRSLQVWRVRKGLREWQLGRFGQMVLVLFATVIIAQWVLRQLGVGI